MTSRWGQQAARKRRWQGFSVAIALMTGVALPAYALQPDMSTGSVSVALAPGVVAPSLGRETHAPATSDPWQVCLSAAETIERDERLPEQMLAAVTTVETGWSKPGARRTRYPWPWTVTAKGRGRHFPTKEAAIEAVRALLAAGVQSIDVGCMQINLYYHPRAFTGLEEAFEPEANMRYAVSFLRHLKHSFGSWEAALEHYHSYDPERRQVYRGKIFSAWAKVQARLERNRLASGISEAPLGAETELSAETGDISPLLGARMGRDDTDGGVELPETWQTAAPVVAISARLLVAPEPDGEPTDLPKRASASGPRVVIPVDLSPRPSDRFTGGLETGFVGNDDRLAPSARMASAVQAAPEGQTRSP